MTALEASISGVRADDPPRRFLSSALHFTIAGAVPQTAVERAIQLSRDKYCSVWHSLREDITLTTSIDIQP